MDYLCNDIFRDLSIDCFASYEAYALSPHMQACIIMTEVVGLSYIAHFFYCQRSRPYFDQSSALFEF